MAAQKKEPGPGLVVGQNHPRSQQPPRRLDTTRAIIGACFFYAALLVIEGVGFLWRRRAP